MITYELDENNIQLTDAERQDLEKAEKMPVVYDKDSPALTPQIAEAFRKARAEKPYRPEMESAV